MRSALPRSSSGGGEPQTGSTLGAPVARAAVQRQRLLVVGARALHLAALVVEHAEVGEDARLDLGPGGGLAVADEVPLAPRRVALGGVEGGAHQVVDVHGGEPAITVAEEDVEPALDRLEQLEVVGVAGAVDAAGAQDGPGHGR